MAIQNRRGSYNDFDKSKMLPGEFAVVQSDDPNSSDGKSLHIAFSAGQTKRLSTYEDMQNEIVNATSDIAEQLAQEIEEAIADDKTAAQTAATQAASSASTASTKASEAAASAQQAATTVATIVDDTLTQTGKAADSKKVGDELTDLKADLSELSMSYDSANKKIIVTLPETA